MTSPPPSLSTCPPSVVSLLVVVALTLAAGCGLVDDEAIRSETTLIGASADDEATSSEPTAPSAIDPTPDPDDTDPDDAEADDTGPDETGADDSGEPPAAGTGDGTPIEYRIEVVATHPHDPEAYT
ncbi:MAG: hypothetical protein ACR2QO_22050, partial [Acidimicrobiales bacterium]